MSENHLVNHIFNKKLTHNNTLHVIGVITNPMRFHSRYRLFREWLEEMEETPNVKVYVVEGAFGHREFEVTDPCNPNHLRIQFTQEIWHKENMINLAVKRLLPLDWRYVCWSDCDVFFNNEHWAQEALHQMQHYSVMQPWSECVDLGFRENIIRTFKSFCYQHQRGVKKQTHPSEPYEYAHTGYIWCARRDFWEAVGGLPDFAILGSADHHAAFAMINEVDKTIKHGMSRNFFRLLEEWQYRAFRHTNGELGYIPGFIRHKHHGRKVNRRYRERWDILIKNHFDPVVDLVHDTQGLVKIIGKPKLVAQCRKYMIMRNEDDIADD